MSKVSHFLRSLSVKLYLQFFHPASHHCQQPQSPVKQKSLKLSVFISLLAGIILVSYKTFFFFLFFLVGIAGSSYLEFLRFSLLRTLCPGGFSLFSEEPLQLNRVNMTICFYGLYYEKVWLIVFAFLTWHPKSSVCSRKRYLLGRNLWTTFCFQYNLVLYPFHFLLEPILWWPELSEKKFYQPQNSIIYFHLCC